MRIDPLAWAALVYLMHRGAVSLALPVAAISLIFPGSLLAFFNVLVAALIGATLGLTYWAFGMAVDLCLLLCKYLLLPLRGTWTAGLLLLRKR